MKTLTEIRGLLRDAVDRTSLCGSETYYPARWTFGESAGDASTSACGDRGLELAATWVARQLGVSNFHADQDVTTQREMSLDIRDALREHEAELLRRESDGDCS